MTAILAPATFGAALAVLLASVALTMGALALLGWAGPRRHTLRGRVAIVVAALVLLALAVYWLTRPFALGAV